MGSHLGFAVFPGSGWHQCVHGGIDPSHVPLLHYLFMDFHHHPREGVSHLPFCSHIGPDRGFFCPGPGSFLPFWEAILIPTYLLISSGRSSKGPCCSEFILYTLAGSALLLVVVIALRMEGGSFSIPALMAQSFSVSFQQWTFLIMALAFAVKVPLFPFHTWLPAAYGQAPIAGSIILSAVMAKMGAYGFLRLALPLAPEAAHFFAPLIIAMSVCSILYGGLLAFAQSNLKKIIAYSSLGHMGFVILGIFLFNFNGVQGALIQMVNHGITTGALFAMVGILYQRSGSHEISGNLGWANSCRRSWGSGAFCFCGFCFSGHQQFCGRVPDPGRGL